MGMFEDDMYFDSFEDLDDDIEVSGLTIVRETEKAWLVEQARNQRQAWLPKSQCEWDEGTRVMLVPDWLNIEWKPTKEK